MKKTTYMKLLIKRAFKIYPAILLVTLVTVMVIGAVAGIMLYQNNTGSKKTKINIGIVGDTSDTYLGVGIEALKEFDSSKYSIEFQELGEEKAKKKLINHEISGYIKIPDDFIRGIMYGENVPVEYYILDDNTGFETAIINEIANMVSDWVLGSQSSIYAMIDLKEDFPEERPDKKINKSVVNMNIVYIDSVIGRSKTFSSQFIGVADSLTMEGYYICGIILFFLLIWGISCNKLLEKNRLGMEKLFEARGIKASWQCLCEYLAYLLCTVVTFLIFAMLLGIIITYNDFGIQYFSGTSVLDCMLFVLEILPAIITVTLMQFMLYELIGSTVNVVVVQFFMAIAMAYISGCFYPNYFFPESIQKFGEILPSGAGFAYIRKCMAGGDKGAEFLLLSAYSVFFAVISSVTRKRHITGDM